MCGSGVTGERVRRRLKGGGVREHIYYRCANNDPGPEHPIVRWRGGDLEDAIAGDLAALQMPTPEIAGWFKRALAAALQDVTENRRRQRQTLAKRRTELRVMEDRLLNAYLGGVIDEPTFRSKTDELKSEAEGVKTSLERCGDADASGGDMALRVFDWMQRLPEIWRGSKMGTRREILESVTLNRTVSDVSLCTEKRKPFDFLAEGRLVQSGTPYRIQTCDLWLRRPALYSLS